MDSKKEVTRKSTFQNFIALLIKFAIKGIVGGIVVGSIYAIIYQDYLILPAINYKVAELTPPKNVQVVQIPTSDHESLVMWHMVGEQTKMPTRGAVIILHGNGDTAQRGLWMQKVFFERGYSTYAINYRGVAGSTGFPSEKGLYLDADAIWQYVTEHEGYSANQIFIYGTSFGTGLTSYLAAKHNPKGIALAAPYASIKDIVADMPTAWFLTPFLKYSIPARDFIKNIKTTCVFIAHGKKDTLINVRQGLELLNILDNRPNVTAMILSDSDHSDITGRTIADAANSFEKCSTN